MVVYNGKLQKKRDDLGGKHTPLFSETSKKSKKKPGEVSGDYVGGYICPRRMRAIPRKTTRNS